MTKLETVKTLIKHKLIAIVRLPESNMVPATIDCLVQGSVQALEITSNTPDYLTHITQARKQYPNTLVGAGTIINAQKAVDAICAGAQFLVTPNVSNDVIEVAHKRNIPVIMGALSPTDFASAINANADIIKLFPAARMGIEYINDLRGPFSDAHIFAVGGIHYENLDQWLSANIQGVGIGNQLCRSLTSKEDAQTHIKYVRSLIDKVNSF